MLLDYLQHAADDLRARRLRAAALQRVRARAVRASRARTREPGRLRRALAFALVEAGLRLLSSRPARERRAATGRAGPWAARTRHPRPAGPVG